MNEKLYICFLCVISIVVLYIYWCYIIPSRYKKIYQKLKLLKGFKHSHLTNQPEEVSQYKPLSHTNCHMSFYGTSGSGKTSFSKYYFDQT